MQKSILLALMSLDIGGVETHVLELAAELAHRGWSVTVASNGGAYQEELEANGVRHLWAPLHNKNPLNIIKSRSILKKDIKEQNYDVVHGHARIPSWILGELQKKLKFEFITSAHWVFKAGFPYNLITNWGERVVAVSKDIKQYLIDNYEYPARNIAITVNGINTDKFSENVPIDDILKEFPIDKKKTQICYVSRMDTDRSAVAFQLIDALIQMNRKDIQTIIVGGGDDFARLQIEANNANEILGENSIIVTGSRTDINKFIANSDIFVGVSRAVLEAMSSAKEVICAGNEGYIGIISDETYELARETNFCCRGCNASSSDFLIHDIEALCRGDGLHRPRATEDGRPYDAAQNREKILQDYSVKKMVDDYEKEYSKLNPKKVMLCGYYGYKNLGDDCLLSAILDNLDNTGLSIDSTILSASPKVTNEEYGARSIARFNIFKIWRAMKKNELLIMGGGSILQDVTSTKSLLYYISIMKIAKKLGLKVMIYANGFGPINKAKNKKRAKAILEKVDVITVREQHSLDYIREIGVENENIYVTADPAFALQGSNEERINELLHINNIEEKYFIVSVRPWADCDKDFVRKIVSICTNIQEKQKLIPVFLIMQPTKDERLTRDICGRIAGAKIIEIYDNTCDIIGIISKAKFTIGMRLHSIIYSAVVKVPFMGIAYDPKVAAISESLGMSEFLIDACDIDVNDTLGKIEKLPETKEVLETKLIEAQKNILKDAACVKKLLITE